MKVCGSDHVLDVPESYRFHLTKSLIRLVELILPLHCSRQALIELWLCSFCVTVHPFYPTNVQDTGNFEIMKHSSAKMDSYAALSWLQIRVSRGGFIK